MQPRRMYSVPTGLMKYRKCIVFNSASTFDRLTGPTTVCQPTWCVQRSPVSFMLNKSESLMVYNIDSPAKFNTERYVSHLTVITGFYLGRRHALRMLVVGTVGCDLEPSTSTTPSGSPTIACALPTLCTPEPAYSALYARNKHPSRADMHDIKNHDPRGLPQ